MAPFNPAAWRSLYVAALLLAAHIAAVSATDLNFTLSSSLHPVTTGFISTQRNTTSLEEVSTSIPPMVTSASTGAPAPTGAGISTDNEARTATATIARPEEDASSKIRTLFFEVAGACIGVATLIVAILALRAMPKKRQHDPESQNGNGDLQPDGAASEQLPSHHTLGQVHELEVIQPAVV